MLRATDRSSKGVVAENEGERWCAAGAILAREPEYKVMLPPDPTAVPMLRITTEIVSNLDYSKGFGHSDLVRVTENDLENTLNRAAITGRATGRHDEL